MTLGSPCVISDLEGSEKIWFCCNFDELVLLHKDVFQPVKQQSAPRCDCPLACYFQYIRTADKTLQLSKWVGKKINQISFDDTVTYE